MTKDSSSRVQPQVMLNGQTLTIEGASIDAEFRHLPLDQVRWI